MFGDRSGRIPRLTLDVGINQNEFFESGMTLRKSRHIPTEKTAPGPKPRSSKSPSVPTGSVSNESFQFSLDLNPLPVIVVAPVTVEVIGVNEAACQQYGYSRDEFLALTLREICPEQKASPEGLEDAARLVDCFQGSRRQRRKDGQIFEAQVAAHTMRFRGADAVVLLVDDRGSCEVAESESALATLGHQLAAAATPVEAAWVISRISRDLIGWDSFFVVLCTPDLKLIPVLHLDTVNEELIECEVIYPEGHTPSKIFQDVMGGAVLSCFS